MNTFIIGLFTEKVYQPHLHLRWHSIKHYEKKWSSTKTIFWNNETKILWTDGNLNNWYMCLIILMCFSWTQVIIWIILQVVDYSLNINKFLIKNLKLNMLISYFIFNINFIVFNDFFINWLWIKLSYKMKKCLSQNKSNYPQSHTGEIRLNNWLDWLEGSKL